MSLGENEGAILEDEPASFDDSNDVAVEQSMGIGLESVEGPRGMPSFGQATKLSTPSRGPGIFQRESLGSMYDASGFLKD